MSDSPSISISACICTMDRPVELDRCLKSIINGERQPDEIIVSDDSRGPATRELCDRWPQVRYVEGPRRGQGPNRQHGASACGRDFVSFIDDDAMVSSNFFLRMAERAAVAGDKVILTGDIVESGSRRSPTNLTFWGHFGKSIGDDALHNVIFSANLFPRRVFDEISFDARIRYGYEDSDFCTRALARGYRIELVDTYNEHLPSPINRVASLSQREWARYYTSLKRYFLVDRAPVAGVTFLLLAPFQAAGSAFIRGRWRDLAATPRDYFRAIRELRDEIRTRRVHAK